MDPSNERQRSRLLLKLALALGSTLLTLSALELVARLSIGERFVFGAHTGSPMTRVGCFDPVFGWTNRAGARAHLVARRFGYDFDYEVEINADGLRGPRLPRERAPDSFRILLLGDSVSWGWGVDYADSYAARLTTALGPGVEVVNAAVPGWGSDQELLWLEREGAGWSPDLVLLCFIYNDIRSNARSEMDGLPKPRFVVDAQGELQPEGLPVVAPMGAFRRELKWNCRRLAAYSALFRWGLLSEEPSVDGRPPLLRVSEGTQAEALEPEERMLQLHFQRSLRDLTEAGAVTHELLARIDATCRARELPLVVLGIPHHHDQYLYDAGQSLPAGESASPFLTPVSKALARAGHTIGFATISVDQRFLEEARRGVVLNCGDGHLNERGNELVAEVLAERLVPLLRSSGK